MMIMLALCWFFRCAIFLYIKKTNSPLGRSSFEIPIPSVSIHLILASSTRNKNKKKRDFFRLYWCKDRLRILYLWIQKIIYIKLGVLHWRRGFGNIESIEDDIDEGDDEDQDRGGIIQFVSSPNARINNFQLLIIIILSPKIPFNSGSTFEMKE